MSYIEVKQEYDARELGEQLWSGAVDTWKQIEKAGKEEQAIDCLNEIFCGETPTMTEINDLLWFEPETVYEIIGLNSEGEEIEEWDIFRSNLEELKERGVLSEEQIEFIEGSLGECDCVTLTTQDFADEDVELSDDQIEELNDVIA